MQAINKLIRYLSFGLQGKCEEKVVTKIFFINLLSFSGFCLFAVFGSLSLATGYLLHGLVSLLASLLILASIFWVRKTQKYLIASRFNLTLVIFVLMFVFVFNQADSSVIIWFSLVPVLSVFILGIRNGSLISLSFMLVTIILLLLPENFSYRPELSTMFQMKLLGLYTAMYIIAAIVEHYRVSHLRTIEMHLLEARNEAKLKESFISKISHQIRTPLNNIMLVGNLVNKVNLTDEQRDLIETILASADNLVKTIENIAEIAGEDIDIYKTPQNIGFNLHTALNNIIRLLAVQKEQLLDFALSVNENIGQKEFHGDPMRLKQIFINLIETIIKNQQPGIINISVRVSIFTQKSDIADIRFEIITNKPVNLIKWDKKPGTKENGFSVPDYPDLVNQLDLNIAEKVICQMGGKLYILQTEEKNRVFLFTLPFKIISSEPAHKTDKLSSEKPVSLTLTPKQNLKDIKVLLVEDNTVNQKIVVLSLKNYLQNIDVANNGKEALDKFGTFKYDIILMDVQMPVIDGLVATKKIREIEATTNSHTPIIAITANALHGDREKCLDAGMDDYLSKPFHVDDLVEKIKLHLSLQ